MTEQIPLTKEQPLLNLEQRRRVEAAHHAKTLLTGRAGAFAASAAPGVDDIISLSGWVLTGMTPWAEEFDADDEDEPEDRGLPTDSFGAF